MSKIKPILEKIKTSTKCSLKCAKLMKNQVVTENKTFWVKQYHEAIKYCKLKNNLPSIIPMRL